MSQFDSQPQHPYRQHIPHTSQTQNRTVSGSSNLSGDSSNSHRSSGSVHPFAQSLFPKDYKTPHHINVSPANPKAVLPDPPMTFQSIVEQPNFGDTKVAPRRVFSFEQQDEEAFTSSKMSNSSSYASAKSGPSDDKFAFKFENALKLDTATKAPLDLPSIPDIATPTEYQIRSVPEAWSVNPQPMTGNGSGQLQEPFKMFTENPSPLPSLPSSRSGSPSPGPSGEPSQSQSQIQSQNQIQQQTTPVSVLRQKSPAGNKTVTVNTKTKNQLLLPTTNNSSPKVPGTPVGMGMAKGLTTDSISRSATASPLNASFYDTSSNSKASLTEGSSNPIWSIDSHDFLQRALGEKSEISLLSTEESLEMYSKNAKKSKEPDVLFTYAKVLLRAALSIQAKGNTNTTKEENKKRKKYLDEAHEALKKAARVGMVEAQYFLGDAYFVGVFGGSGKPGKPDYYKALTYFETSGKMKHAEGAYRTALCYRKGLGCKPDARKVIKFTEIAALNGHPVAMMELGIYCFHGIMGLSDDVNIKKKGISWLRRATEVAIDLSCGAPYELALIYLNGFRDIVIKDTNYAIKLLFQAANLGHAKSSSMLGKFYEIGDVVEANADLSIHFYNLAATMGDVDGMMGLCSWYFVGTDHLPQDYDESFAWALRSAESGLPKAMLLLQSFYDKGIGCKVDKERAKYWGEQAAKCTSNEKRKKK